MAERTTFRQLVAFAKKHAPSLDGLLFYKVDRAARNLFDAVKAFELSQTLREQWLAADHATKRRLLERGAKPDALDDEGLTPLLHLSKTRSKADPIPVMELLAASGANLDARDQTQNTLLMYFARQGKAEPVRWLLAHGADRNASNKRGKTAAQIGRAHVAIVRLLAK